MIKFISPFVHLLFLAPVYALFYLAFRLGWIVSEFALIAIIVVLTVGFFLLANKAMEAMDDSVKPKFVSHLKQCSLLYLYAIVVFATYPGCVPVIYEGKIDPFECAPTSQALIGLLNLSLVVVALAVATNIGYLIYRRFHPRKK